MGLAGQNQVRHMYVGASSPVVADIAALKIAADGSLVILNSQGTAASAGDDFKAYHKTPDGIVTSDTIKVKNVLSIRSVAHKAPVLGKVTMSGLAVPVAGEFYAVEIVIKGFGSLSPEDEYIKKGFYKAVAGDTAQNVVDGLIASLNRNFSREVGSTATTNETFTFSKTGSGATTALVIEEKAQPRFNKDKRTRLITDFTVSLTATTQPTYTVVAGSSGVGNGKQIAADEFYLMGERGDFYRGAGYPNNFDTTYFADESSNYNLIEIAYFDEGRDEAKKSRKQLTLAVPQLAAPNAPMNLGLVAILNTINPDWNVEEVAAV